MAANASHSAPHDSGDRPYPTSNMLRPFRVRNIRPAGDDGVVRMKRDEYDQLLKRQPAAALRYIDESDGEVILVGSSLELDQRLQEPTENAPVTIAGVTLDLYGTGSKQLHTFEVDHETSVIETWQHLDQRTTTEGQKAKEVFFGRSAAALDKGKQKSEVRFGQVTPPRSSLKVSPNPAPENAHSSRWASYSNLPGSFNHEAVPVTTESKNDIPLDPLPATSAASTQDHGAAAQHQPESQPPRSAFDVMADAASTPVRSSTLQVPASQKQKNEYQPLIDMFFTEENTSKAAPSDDTSKEQPKQWQPLLDLFEGQLAELASSSTAEKVESTPALKGPFAQKSGELLTQSIQSLLNGVGLLAATFKKTNAELQQQIALAQQDFPNNIEKALKASVAAIESLRSMIPAANNESSGPAPATESNEEQLRVGDSNPVESQNSMETQRKILFYRYKLQKHLMQTAVYPTPEELRMLNDILEDLELMWKGLDAEVLMETKVHKVMKAVSRMKNVPGDEEFSFKQRCTDLLAVWMKTLETYKQAKRNTKRPHDASKANNTTEAAPKDSTTASLVSSTPTMSAQNDNTPEDGKASTTDASPAYDDDQVDRVELATETMRRQLLDMGLLPPAERPLGGVYTRADVLEAYIHKFNELKALIGQSGDFYIEGRQAPAIDSARPDLYHDLDQLEARRTPLTGSRLGVDDFYLRDAVQYTASNAVPSLVVGSVISDTAEPDEPKTAKNFGRLPKKAVSFDHIAVDIGRNIPRPTEAETKERGTEPGTQAHNESLLPAQGLPSTCHSTQEPPKMNWPGTKPGPNPSLGTRQVRHRQSWHPVSTPAASNDGRYPFSFSTSDVMARYPPISHINQNSTVSPLFPYSPHAPPLGPSHQMPRPWPNPVESGMTPNEPKLWRSSTFNAPTGHNWKAEAPPPASSDQRGQPQYTIKPEVHNPPRQPGGPGVGTAAAQRSTSTRVTRAEHEKLRGEKQQRKAGRFAERRRRRMEGEWELKPAAEHAEQVSKQGEIQKCVEQLTGMGFARGKVDAVANAVLGNLEMALDVLNEDSAAWEAKAKQDEQRELRREREEVPGSWGSWDDELYG